jgi:hypothetical protein
VVVVAAVRSGAVVGGAVAALVRSGVDVRSATEEGGALEVAIGLEEAEVVGVTST